MKRISLTRATTTRLDLVTHFRSACSSRKTFSIFCLIFIRWSYLFPLYCSCRRFYRNSETTVQQEHQLSTTALKIMEEEKSFTWIIFDIICGSQIVPGTIFDEVRYKHNNISFIFPSFQE